MPPPDSRHIKHSPTPAHMASPPPLPTLSSHPPSTIHPKMNIKDLLSPAPSVSGTPMPTLPPRSSHPSVAVSSANGPSLKRQLDSMSSLHFELRPTKSPKTGYNDMATLHTLEDCTLPPINIGSRPSSYELPAPTVVAVSPDVAVSKRLAVDESDDDDSRSWTDRTQIYESDEGGEDGYVSDMRGPLLKTGSGSRLLIEPRMAVSGRSRHSKWWEPYLGTHSEPSSSRPPSLGRRDDFNDGVFNADDLDGFPMKSEPPPSPRSHPLRSATSANLSAVVNETSTSFSPRRPNLPLYNRSKHRLNSPGSQPTSQVYVCGYVPPPSTVSRQGIPQPAQRNHQPCETTSGKKADIARHMDEIHGKDEADRVAREELAPEYAVRYLVDLANMVSRGQLPNSESAPEWNWDILRSEAQLVKSAVQLNGSVFDFTKCPMFRRFAIAHAPDHRIWRCRHQGCGNIYGSQRSLERHRQKTHSLNKGTGSVDPSNLGSNNNRTADAPRRRNAHAHSRKPEVWRVKEQTPELQNMSYESTTLRLS
ncbi:hypothetical protein FRC03_007371 [Tulasnella sp. 419]|nr:hypothetical protein FRC03_007371 [Tulasnella sp. 419]